MSERFGVLAGSLLLIGVVVVLSACQTLGPSLHGSFTLQEPPPPRLVRVNGKPITLSGQEVYSKLASAFPGVDSITVHDGLYTVPEKEWVMELLQWSDQYLDSQLPPAQHQDYMNRHGDMVAVLVSSVGISSAAYAGSPGPPLLGGMFARSKQTWGRIPADGKTRVYLLAFAGGEILVIDMATRQIAPASAFPNRRHVEEAAF